MAVGLWGTLCACGGSVAKHDNVQPAVGGSGSTSGAGAPPAAGGTADVPSTGGASDEVAGGPTSESLDDSSYPPVPQGSAGFIWRRGVGNWFVTPVSGKSRDAGFETLDGVKVWETRAEPGVTDLWAQLNHPRGTPIDLSGYTGVAFEVRALSASAPLVVTFNADGNVAAGEAVADAQRFTVSDTWQSFELSFAEANVASTAVSSVDFIISPSELVQLQVRKLALKCKRACP